MTPTHKDLVEALREAERTLEFYSRKRTYDREFDYQFRRDVCDIDADRGAKARSTLSKINPILKELENE